MQTFVANNEEEVKKIFPEADYILEEYISEEEKLLGKKSRYFLVFQGRKFIARVYKPRNKEDVKNILIEGNFPYYFIEEIFNAKKTSVFQKIIQAPKEKGLVASGQAGIGKTFSIIFKIAKLLKYFKINKPLYLTLQDVNAYHLLYKERLIYKYDLLFIDDVNSNLTKVEKRLVETIVFHTYNERKKLYITTNQSIKDFFNFINEEPIRSRIIESCELLELEEKEDLRVQKAMRR